MSFISDSVSVSAMAGPGQTTTTQSGSEFNPLLVLGGLPQAVIAASVEGTISYANPAVEKLLGWSAQQLQGLPLTTIIPERMHSAHLAGFARFLRTNAPTVIGKPVRLPALHRDGSEVEIDLTLSAFPGDEQIQGFIGVLHRSADRPATEITRLRHKALAADIASAVMQSADLVTALQGSAEALVRQLEVCAARIWTVSEEGNQLELQGNAGVVARQDGPHAQLLIGEHRVGLIAQQAQPYVTNDLLHDTLFADHEWAQREGIIGFAGFPLLVGPQLVGVMAVFARHPNSEEAVEALASIAETVALGIARLRAESALRDQHERYQLISRATKDPIWDWDFRTNLMSWSDAVLPTFGYLQDDIGKTSSWWIQNLHPEDRDGVVASVQQMIAGGCDTWSGEYRFRRKDGSYAAVFDRGTVVRNRHGKAVRIVGVMLDLTERKQLEKEIADQKSILDLVIEQSGEGIIMADEGGVLRIFNPAAERQHGATKQEVSAPDWSRTYGLFSLDDEPLQLEDTPLFKAVLGIACSNVSWKVRRPDGSTRTLGGTATPLRRADGSAAGGVLITRDETERHRHEVDRERLLLALAKSNADLDQFAYVASHDLKAPLRGIANLAQWIEEDIGDALGGEARENMDLLQGRVKRLEGLIDGILAYSRAGRSQVLPEEINVGPLLAEVVELLAPGPDADIRIEPPMPSVVAERIPFQQVFLNLVGNALKYAGASAKVEIRAREDGEFVIFTVSDNGPGIEPAYHHRVWGIFQTLEARDDVEGTGIGLSIVRKIVETRGGRAWVESDLGAGASFHVRWPKRAPQESS